MNIEKNQIPDHVRKIHLIAICGTAMGALACMLQDMGFEVTGSDNQVYPPMSDFLVSRGIRITEGFHEKNIAYQPDLVIVGNAVTRNNPEAQAMADMNLCFCSMPQAVNHFMAANKKSIVITGTHGKTTTSSLTAWILHKAGLNPSFLIGGILKNFNSNYHFGNGGYVVLEGDEYDTAFFDKGPKFLHYSPYMAILTNIEFDHADIFRDIDHIKQAFHTFTSRISHNSTLVAFNEDKHIAELIRDTVCQIATYGRNSNSSWQIGSVSIEPPWTIFEVLKHKKLFGKFRTKQVGEHNLLNTLSAIAIADNLNIPPDVIYGALESFEGIRRRQDIRGKENGITVIDDFAHHPTAVKETIRGVRPFYPKGRMIAVFEPRTNSSMRKIFQDVYPLSFDDADMICIRKPSRLDKIPVAERLSSEKLVADLCQRGKDAYHFSDTESIIEFLSKAAKTDDVILIMSNGGFDNIHERLLAQIRN